MNLLTKELMGAAEVLLHQGETLEVIFHKNEARQVRCLLTGYGEAAGTAQLGVWYNEEFSNAGIAFGRIEVPFGTYHQLQGVLRAQGANEPAAQESSRMTELAARLMVIAQARLHGKAAA